MEPEKHIQNRMTMKTVLVLDSDAHSCRETAQLLAKQYTVLEAKSESEGLAMLLEENADIAAVILDLRSARIDGRALLTRIRQNPMLAFLPVIVLSGRADAEAESTFLELGASDYITLPVPEKVLFSRIQNLIRICRTVVQLDLLEKDDLTGLYNRQAFVHHAGALLDADASDFDLVIADIDKFKLINAIYGAEKANELLKSVARVISAEPGTAICARYGADRFIWLQRTDKPCSEQIDNLMSKLHGCAPIVDITIRCGVYGHVDRNLPIIRMCDNATLALKSIKTDFGKTIAYYDGPVSQRHLREQLYAARFPEALKNREFAVWYQPKFDPFTTKVVGAEALVRWKNPDGSVNLPGEFLSVFEANGMISRLDEYVFETVCAQQKKWKDAGKPLIPISVNLSRNSMHKKNLAQVYAGIARKYGVEPRFLPIEITETTATDSIEIQKNADAIHREGFPLHMDDFGSEHSSLHTLNVLDFDTVKLDKGLIDFIGNKEGDLVLIYTMALGGELGLRIVAEGVETKQQLDFLMGNGCDQIQGYYFSRPLPLEEFEKKIADNLEPESMFVPAKEGLYVLSLASHIEKTMTQRMLPRIPGGFFIYEEAGDEKIVYSNEYLWNMFGCTTEAEFMEHVHGSFRGVVSPEELDRVEQSIREQIEGSVDGMDYVQYQIVRKDGQRIPVVDYGHLERLEKGNLFYVFLYKLNP